MLAENRSFRIAVAVLFGLALLLGCSRERNARRRSLMRQPERGEKVVVEATAADFYEATVIESDAGLVRVQRVDDGSSARVSVSDVYVIAPRPVRWAISQLAICRVAPARWLGCRIRAFVGSELAVVDPEGNALRLKSGDLLLPEEVTRLNLERRFEQSQERVLLKQELEKAGGPRRPPGFRPSVGQRVLAEQEGRWYDAIVREVDDDSVNVEWMADRSTAELPERSVVPGPPLCGNPRAKAYALTRSEGPATPWEIVQVLSLDPPDAKIRDQEQRERTVGVRDLCPLGAEP